MTELGSRTDILSKEEVDNFWTQGYLRVPDVYAPDEVDELAEELDLLIDRWAMSSPWTGPWREALLDADLAAKIELRGLHDLRYYSAAWARATSNAKLARVLRCLLGDAVELHHTTMHVKPPERGQPFPLHQDWPFYPHTDDRYIDVLLHLDDDVQRLGHNEALADNAQRLIDGRHGRFFKLHVDCRARNLNYFADVLCHSFASGAKAPIIS